MIINKCYQLLFIYYNCITQKSRLQNTKIIRSTILACRRPQVLYPLPIICNCPHFNQPHSLSLGMSSMDESFHSFPQTLSLSLSVCLSVSLYTLLRPTLLQPLV